MPGRDERPRGQRGVALVDGSGSPTKPAARERQHEAPHVDLALERVAADEQRRTGEPDDEPDHDEDGLPPAEDHAVDRRDPQRDRRDRQAGHARRDGALGPDDAAVAAEHEERRHDRGRRATASRPGGRPRGRRTAARSGSSRPPATRNRTPVASSGGSVSFTTRDRDERGAPDDVHDAQRPSRCRRRRLRAGGPRWARPGSWPSRYGGAPRDRHCRSRLCRLRTATATEPPVAARTTAAGSDGRLG